MLLEVHDGHVFHTIYSTFTGCLNISMVKVLKRGYITRARAHTHTHTYLFTFLSDFMYVQQHLNHSDLLVS